MTVRSGWFELIMKEMAEKTWLKSTPQPNPRVNFTENERGKRTLSQKTASNIKLKEKTGQRASHSSSCASSCSCRSFMFRWNGTASGFIKIYEQNHHWKYKTLAGARGEMGEEGEQMEREGNSSGWIWWGEKQMRRKKTNWENLVKQQKNNNVMTASHNAIVIGKCQNECETSGP